jgi:hypothetical protein
MMKKLWISTLVLLGNMCAAHAQETIAGGLATSANAAADFATTVASVEPEKPAYSPGTLSVSNALGAPAAPLATSTATGALNPSLSDSESASRSFADPPAPEPRPKFLYGGRDDYRWQVALGFAWQRFQSSIFNASAIGVSTGVSYFTNNWFAIDGNLSAVFAPSVFKNSDVKLLNYGIGPKIAWRQKRWEPWAHALVGGAHEQPQIAGNSKNGYSVQAGGGVDFRWNPRISFRLQGDYVRTAFFQETQNNYQGTASIVFHF